MTTTVYTPELANSSHARAEWFCPPYQGDVDPPELAAQLAVHLQQDFLDHAPHLARLARKGLRVDDLRRGGGQKKNREKRGWRCPRLPRAGGPLLPSPSPTWEGTGDCTQHSFLMAPYKSSRLLEIMQRSSCTLSCEEAQQERAMHKHGMQEDP